MRKLEGKNVQGLKMESLAALYKNHIGTLQERARNALDRFKLDALLIHSGELMNVFLDDHAYPFQGQPAV